MAEFSPMTPSEVALGVGELDNLARILGFPDNERHSILGLSSHAYCSWQSGLDTVARSAPPELVRRLSYALPLMRRMAANMSSGAIRRDRSPSHPISD